MLDRFVEKLDYARWFAENFLNIPPSILNRKLSYVEMAKSVLSNSPVLRPNFKVTDQPPSQNKKFQKSVHLPPSKQKHWLIKNHEVLKVNFENLWIISKLFASDDWKLIRKRLEALFQAKIVINPLYDENALINIDQGSILDLIQEEGKWQAFEESSQIRKMG